MEPKFWLASVSPQIQLPRGDREKPPWPHRACQIPSSRGSAEGCSFGLCKQLLIWIL